MGNDILEWLFEHAMPWVVLVVIAALVLALSAFAYTAWVQSKSPTFTLRKNEWACTQVQRVPITTYIQNGSVLVPITAYRDECHQWSRQP